MLAREEGLSATTTACVVWPWPWLSVYIVGDPPLLVVYSRGRWISNLCFFFSCAWYFFFTLIYHLYEFSFSTSRSVPLSTTLNMWSYECITEGQYDTYDHSVCLLPFGELELSYRFLLLVTIVEMLLKIFLICVVLFVEGCTTMDNDAT